MKIVTIIAFLLATPIFSQQLSPEVALQLSTLPLKCMQQEFPNKLGQVVANTSELQSPKQLHPAFYGCFDWHSSVHGHWSLVYLLNKFPNLVNKSEIVQKLQQNLSKQNIAAEVAYLSKSHEKAFERTYGWAWVLKLQHELDASNQPFAAELSKNLQPLTDLIISRYTEFLPKLVYPVRAGTHNNTAFALNLAYDYAIFSKNEQLRNLITDSALRLYWKDANCPLSWEPSGTDFLSPCLEELALMQRILPSDNFIKWTEKFLPQIFPRDFALTTAQVSDRTDGHLVHLDGLNFSRAYNFYRIAKPYPQLFAHLKTIADQHLQFAMVSVADGNYEGEHWLASFALLAYQSMD
ncbi:MAG: DUF2891 domain-containing protein [Flavobacterium sp.]|nr:DUF2891 domain-containing protein [Flavobacterium sp.]